MAYCSAYCTPGWANNGTAGEKHNPLPHNDTFTHLLCAESVLAGIQVPFPRLLRRGLLRDLCRALLGELCLRFAALELAALRVQVGLCLCGLRGRRLEWCF
jgi:hypothetical protein